MFTGIYAIVSPSDKRYIGSAVNVRTRWNAHRHALRSGLHHSEALQRAYDKYGESLQFVRVLQCAKADLLMYEQLVIDAYAREDLLNTSYIAASRAGTKHSVETREKMRKARLDRNAQLTPEDQAKQSAALSRSVFGVKKKTNTSGFVGVNLQRGRTWRASARLGGKKHSIPGKFATAAEAHAAREAYVAAYKTMIESRE